MREASEEVLAIEGLYKLGGIEGYPEWRLRCPICERAVKEGEITCGALRCKEGWKEGRGEGECDGRGMGAADMRLPKEMSEEEEAFVAEMTKRAWDGWKEGGGLRMVQEVLGRLESPREEAIFESGWKLGYEGALRDSRELTRVGLELGLKPKL